MVTFEQGLGEEEPAVGRRSWGTKQQEQEF